MRKVVYKDRLILMVGEVSYAKALQVVQLINVLIDAKTDDTGFISNEFNFAYVSNAPVKVLWDGNLLPDGTHTLAFDEFDGITLTLPLTREAFEALPVSLTARWTEAAQLENEWLNNHFLSVVQRIAPTLLEPASDKPQS